MPEAIRQAIREAAGTAAGPSGHPVAPGRCSERLGGFAGKPIERTLPVCGVFAEVRSDRDRRPGGLLAAGVVIRCQRPVVTFADRSAAVPVRPLQPVVQHTAAGGQCRSQGRSRVVAEQFAGPAQSPLVGAFQRPDAVAAAGRRDQRRRQPAPGIGPRHQHAGDPPVAVPERMRPHEAVEHPRRLHDGEPSDYSWLQVRQVDGAVARSSPFWVG